MYTKRLQELNVEVTTRVHTTRLKERILFQFEDMHAYAKGRQVYLAHGNAAWEALKAVSNVQYNNDGYN